MKKELSILFIFILIFNLGFILSLPQDPCVFYGEINYNGTAIPEGYEISAYIGNVLKEKGDVISGEYGIKDSFIVSGSSGSSVEFFIGDEKIAEHEFKAKGIFEFNIDLEFLPEKPISSASDGECNVSAGECSTNAVDCSPLLTDICSTNGVCDVEIGEDCLNAPADCGECETEETNNENTNTNNNNPGGGPSGGSPGGYYNPKKENVSTNETNNETINLSDSNKTEEFSEDKSGFFRTTGHAVSDFVKTKTGKGLIVILVLAVLVAIYFGIKKISKKK